MSEFEDREKAFENKFGHDSELQFKIMTRAVNLLGQWVADQLGMSGAEIETYGKSLVEFDIAKNGHDDILEKIETDLAAKQLSFSHHRLERELESCYSKAREQIMGSGKTS